MDHAIAVTNILFVSVVYLFNVIVSQTLLGTWVRPFFYIFLLILLAEVYFDLYFINRDEILSIVLVGHSLGASLAVLSAFDIVENGLSQIAPSHHFPVCAIAFGCPQVGNRAFTKRFETLPQLRVLRIKNKNDLIPLYPTGLLGYTNTGAELVIDQTKSPYLKDSKNASDWHNLQGILHALAGWNGEDKEFALRVKRSVALVNKSSEYLKDDLLVPGSWWVQENKGMVLGEDGEWEMGKLDPDDLPVPPK